MIEIDDEDIFEEFVLVELDQPRPLACGGWTSYEYRPKELEA